MATRCQHENSNEVGVFAALTNAYCLTGASCVMNHIHFVCFVLIGVINSFRGANVKIAMTLYRCELFRELFLCIRI